MRHLGIEERLIKTIMACVQSISYAVLLNGQPVGNIKPTRGFRQGDPLSPYLFLLCAMGLQSLIHQAEVDGHIRGVAICRNGPKFPTYFLQMIACCFVELQRLNVIKFWRSWRCMRKGPIKR